jgi:hypothetical protein
MVCFIGVSTYFLKPVKENFQIKSELIILTFIGLSALISLLFTTVISKKPTTFSRCVYASLAFAQILISGSWVVLKTVKQKKTSPKSSSSAETPDTIPVIGTNPNPKKHFGLTHLLQVLEDEEKRRDFEKFLVQEFAVENLLFWSAVQKFKQTFSSDRSWQMSVEIFNEFCASDSRITINISYKTRDELSRFFKSQNNQGNLSATVFDIAVNEVLKLLAHDSFARYVSHINWHHSAQSTTLSTSQEV